MELLTILVPYQWVNLVILTSSHISQNSGKFFKYKSLTSESFFTTGLLEPSLATRKIPEHLNAQNRHGVATEFYLFLRKGEIMIKPLKGTKNGHHNQFRVWESVIQGEGVRHAHIRCTQRKLLINYG